MAISVARGKERALCTQVDADDNAHVHLATCQTRLPRLLGPISRVQRVPGLDLRRRDARYHDVSFR
jgi:hypothetical protein